MSQQTQQEYQQEDPQQKSAFSTKTVGESDNHKCQCLFPCVDYDGVHHEDAGSNDFSHLRNYTICGKKCCLVCHKPISQTSNAGGSCQQNIEEEKCVVFCPLCDHPCEINGQPCGIHTKEACIYT